MVKDQIDSIMTSVVVVTEVAVFVPILMRKIWRVLPVFSAYLLWALLSDIAGLIVQRTHLPISTYLQFYKGEMIADSCLLFIVLVELCWSVLRPVRNSLPKGAIFVIAGLIAVAGLLIWPLAGKALPDMLPISASIFRLQATFAILRVICFLVMAGFSQLLAINWRDRELQVATGLGIYALVSLTVSIYHSHQLAGTPAYHNLDLIVSGGYVGTLIYWVLSFSAKEYERKEFSPQMQQFLVYMGGTAKAGSLALSKIPPDHSRKRDR